MVYVVLYNLCINLFAYFEGKSNLYTACNAWFSSNYQDIG